MPSSVNARNVPRYILGTVVAPALSVMQALRHATVTDTLISPGVFLRFLLLLC
jgi:hypothetical protein